MSFKHKCYGLALLVIALDQLTKAWVSARLDYGAPEEIFSWFNLTLLHNRGAAFSFLNDAGGWQVIFFSGLAIAISVVLVLWLRFAKKAKWKLFLGLGLILGGAVGNLIDRVRFGYVVDFIQVHYQDWYYPAFNVADSAITVGAALLIIDALFSPNSDVPETESGGDPAE